MVYGKPWSPFSWNHSDSWSSWTNYLPSRPRSAPFLWSREMCLAPQVHSGLLRFPKAPGKPSAFLTLYAWVIVRMPSEVLCRKNPGG